MGGIGRLLRIRQCSVCGKDIEIHHKIRMESTTIYCSRKCYKEKLIEKPKANVKCAYCNKEFYLKPSHLSKTDTHCCSEKCLRNLRKTTYSGKNNPQYGLKGILNDSWKSDVKITHYGYRKIRALDHPFKDIDDFVFEHRLIAEKYLLTSENSIKVGDKSYLKDTYVVHHEDFNRLNNKVNNLKVMTKSDHIKWHWQIREQCKIYKSVI